LAGGTGISGFNNCLRARRRGALVIAAVLLAAAWAGWARPASAASPPPAGGSEVLGEPCQDRTYPECRRIRFAYGPIVVTPGNNMQVVGPVTVQKPLYDGYVTRFRPDMVRADGVAPPTDEVMLHHATWLNTARYGPTVPFMAAGEEKTILEPKPGYGYLVPGTDNWQINYMIHNATPRTETLWVVWDLDFVPKDAAERRGIRNVVPLWLDVLRNSDRPVYPVFNVQKGFGQINRATGRRECAFPRERCAAFDPYGRLQPANGTGWDYTIPEGLGGTIVGMAGHVHPGGLRDEVSVVRGEGPSARVRHIFDSEAIYWDPRGPVSWDMSMTATKPEWRVKVRAGDRLRLNGVYDSQIGSWYEGMGIVMAFVAPGDESGVDPFAYVRVREQVSAPACGVRRRHRRGRGRRVRKRASAPACKVRRRHRRGRGRRVRSRASAAARKVRHRPGHGRRRARRRAKPTYRWVWRPVPIDTTGRVTHGHLPENSNHGGDYVRPLTARDGPETTQIGIGNFHYSQGDLSTVDSDGIPRVRYGSRLSFWNFDAAAGIWHTITTCVAPCTGTYGISYPLADDPQNLDSLVLGYSPTGRGTQPAADRAGFEIDPARNGLRPGTVYTYFCRVHPFMRGAFKVVP
jgi:hypothetical protein